SIAQEATIIATNAIPRITVSTWIRAERATRMRRYRIATSQVNVRDTVLTLVRPHLWEEDHVADRRLIGEQHDHAIDADAFARGGRHAVLERAAEVLVVVHRLFVAARLGLHLRLEATALIDWIVQLGERVGVLAPADEQLEAIGELGIAIVAAR